MPKSVPVAPETEVKPDPSLERRTRRKFSADYKLRIIREADACKHGDLGALLRKEKLYSNQLADWRRELADNGVEGLSKSTPGPASSKTPEQRQIERLEKENSRLLRKLKMANDCLDLQKKAMSMLDHLNNGNKT